MIGDDVLRLGITRVRAFAVTVAVREDELPEGFDRPDHQDDEDRLEGIAKHSISADTPLTHPLKTLTAYSNTPKTHSWLAAYPYAPDHVNRETD